MGEIKPYYENENGRLYHGDCLEILPHLEPVDLVLTDPPYFLPAQHYQTRKNFKRNFSDLGILEHFFRTFFELMRKRIKTDGFIYLFCDGQSYPLFYYYSYFVFKTVKPLIWDKIISFNGYGWRHQHEIILWGSMDNAKPIPTGDGDILKFRAVKIDERKHPAEKPVGLLTKILEKHNNCNSVLDPFSGSGTTAIVCEKLKLKWVCIETDEQYCDIAVKRIEHERQQLKLF